MFGSSSNSPGPKSESDNKSDKSSSPEPSAGSDSGKQPTAPTPIKKPDQAASGEKRSGNGSPPTRNDVGTTEKKRRSSSVSSKASSLLASAKNSLSFSPSSRNSSSEVNAQSPLQKMGKQDPALAVPQGQHNNSAGESFPGPKSTFRVGVWEDRNKKCRRTMEDTHAFLYNFLNTPTNDVSVQDKPKTGEVVESDNGYFAIFDGHAGTFAADWCGKKLHILLEDLIRKNPAAPIPEVLDQAFTAADNQLEKLPLKNSGCTAAVAVLRWEERNAVKTAKPDDSQSDKTTAEEPSERKTKSTPPRQRVLYTANVGDARIILCRSGKALRLSYDHKGSDENEGKRIANAGGLILNNRVNGVLAVTRALGDTYMKKLVTGHPYTTETVIQPEIDEFIIIACDGLWDVSTDQEAVDLVRGVDDPVAASKLLVDHALGRFSTDNLSCMIVRLDKQAQEQRQNNQDIVLDPDGASQISEADKIVDETKQNINQGTTPAIGVSASNNAPDHESTSGQEGDFVPTSLDEAVVEEPEETADGGVKQTDEAAKAEASKAEVSKDSS